jgi:hypothetical protein
VDEMID